MARPERSANVSPGISGTVTTVPSEPSQANPPVVVTNPDELWVGDAEAAGDGASDGEADALPSDGPGEAPDAVATTDTTGVRVGVAGGVVGELRGEERPPLPVAPASNTSATTPTITSATATTDSPTARGRRCLIDAQLLLALAAV
jgi:hypothetical protein